MPFARPAAPGALASALDHLIGSGAGPAAAPEPVRAPPSASPNSSPGRERGSHGLGPRHRHLAERGPSGCEAPRLDAARRPTIGLVHDLFHRRLGRPRKHPGALAVADASARCRCSRHRGVAGRNAATGRSEWQWPVVKDRNEVVAWLGATRTGGDHQAKLVARLDLRVPSTNGSTASSTAESSAPRSRRAEWRRDDRRLPAVASEPPASGCRFRMPASVSG